MALILERHRPGAAPARDRRSHDGERDRKSGPVVNVALVNNMPDTALAATERQFRRLLKIASGDRIVRLHCFSLPSVRRSPEARQSIAGLYRQIADLDRLEIDGLLVTGAEPIAASLRDEPFWPALTALVDWARDNTVSTIWSCLAAHAAVLHLDGIERRRLGAKCSGIFACEPSSPHWLLREMGPNFAVPHSRLNALDPAELSARGYEILTRSDEAGLDVFARKIGRSEFVFFQGHPEYAASTLKQEFVRDLRRYLVGDSDTAPQMPAHYFDDATEAKLRAFMAGLARDRNIGRLDELPNFELRAGASAIARRSGEILLRNWVDRVIAQSRHRRPSRPSSLGDTIRPAPQRAPAGAAPRRVAVAAAAEARR